MDDEILEELYEKNSKELLEVIRKHNNTESLLFSGEYNKDGQGRAFGFFSNILGDNSNELKYPVINTKIESVFIFTNELENGNRYFFLVDISIKKKGLRNKILSF